jgi:sulfate permease, SulP family
MIIFPASGVFADLGGMGVSMFFVTYVLLSLSSCIPSLTPFGGENRTLIAQLTYTLGGSGFAGANGSMMIEVVVCPLPLPLVHI